MPVSVVIPAYNAAATIAETLQSVREQTDGHWEAVVVNDGSTDDTGAIARSFATRDQRILVVDQPNGGEAAARNCGVKRARHPWLLFLDSDDWIAPGHVEAMTAQLAADPSLDAVLCRYARVAGDGSTVVDAYRPPTGDLFPILARRAAFPVHACVVRRALVHEVGLFDPSFQTSADWDLWQRVARTGANFGGIDDVLAFYRMSARGRSLEAVQLFSDGFRILQRGQGPDSPGPASSAGSRRRHRRTRAHAAVLPALLVRRPAPGPRPRPPPALRHRERRAVSRALPAGHRAVPVRVGAAADLSDPERVGQVVAGAPAGHSGLPRRSREPRRRARTGRGRHRRPPGADWRAGVGHAAPGGSGVVALAVVTAARTTPVK